MFGFAKAKNNFDRSLPYREPYVALMHEQRGNMASRLLLTTPGLPPNRAVSKNNQCIETWLWQVPSC